MLKEFSLLGAAKNSMSQVYRLLIVLQPVLKNCVFDDVDPAGNA